MIFPSGAADNGAKLSYVKVSKHNEPKSDKRPNLQTLAEHVCQQAVRCEPIDGESLNRSSLSRAVEHIAAADTLIKRPRKVFIGLHMWTCAAEAASGVCSRDEPFLTLRFNSRIGVGHAFALSMIADCSLHAFP